MCTWRKKALVSAIVTVMIFSLASVPAMAQEEHVLDEPNAVTMIADFVLLRPLGIAATAVGTVFFVGSLPFSLAGGNVKPAFKYLVSDPVKFTFTRPLGKVQN